MMYAGGEKGLLVQQEPERAFLRFLYLFKLLAENMSTLFRWPYSPHTVVDLFHKN